MKFKTLFASASLLVMASVASQAAVLVTISTNPTTGASFTLSNGVTKIPDGALVRVGVMSAAPAAGATMAEIELLFTQFATTTSGHSAPAGANKGMINRASIGDGPADPPETFFVGKQVYLWVYDGTTAANSTHAGVFTSSDASWKFPNSPDDPTAALSTLLINGAFGKTAFGQAGITAGQPNTYQLALIVPEPSVATFSLLSIVGLVGYRRRR